ncbi:MAG: hypothetical protein R3324_10600, partial [Halobacteriales archaeon]|nr:hypothetical protein [Halobacteriales archaeon]
MSAAETTAGAIELKLHAVREKRDVSFFDLTTIDDVSVADLSLRFSLARVFRDAKTTKLGICKGHSQVNAFFESSTRTQSSFDLSAKHLSM